MIAQLGLMKQAAFAGFHGHLRSVVDVEIKSGQCTGGLRVFRSAADGLLQLIARSESPVNGFIQRVEIFVNL